MTSLTAGFAEAAEREPGPETPGICGISVLKRSDGGWSVILLRFDSILKEAFYANDERGLTALILLIRVDTQKGVAQRLGPLSCKNGKR